VLKVKVKGHVIRALSWILGMSYSVIDGLVSQLLCVRLVPHGKLWNCCCGIFCQPTNVVQGCSHVSKIVWVSIFPSCPYKRPTTVAKKASRTEHLGGSVLLSSQIGGVGCRNLPSGAWGGVPITNDLWAFHVQFYPILRILVHLTAACKQFPYFFPG